MQTFLEYINSVHAKKKPFKIFFLSLFFAPVFFQMPALINNFISDIAHK